MEETKSYFDEVVFKIKNNKFFAILLLGMVAYFGVTKLIKETSSVAEVIHQKDVEQAPASADLKPAKHIVSIIQGKVQDADNRPLPNARINLVELAMIAGHTDSEGYFILEVPTDQLPAVTELTITQKGYQVWTKKILKEKNLKINLGRIILKKEEKKVAKNPVSSRPAGVEKAQIHSSGDFNFNLENKGEIGNINVAKKMILYPDAKDTIDD